MGWFANLMSIKRPDKVTGDKAMLKTVICLACELVCAWLINIQIVIGIDETIMLQCCMVWYVLFFFSDLHYERKCEKKHVSTYFLSDQIIIVGYN